MIMLSSMFLKIGLVFAILPGFLLTEDAGTLSRTKRQDDFQVDGFFETFGYMDVPTSSQGGHDAADRERAVREFQKMTGIPITGKVDKETVTKMKSPRCGFQDVLRPSQRPGEINTNPKDVQLKPLSNVFKWPKNQVTWKVMGYTRQLGGASQRSSFINAFKKWSDVANINIREVGGGDADILIDYKRRDHYDGSPFDGKGRTLAHAFFPGSHDISGDTHFDDDEQWTLGTKEGTNLEIVAAHEFGHALGLGHSSNSKALMAPYYQGYDPDYKLLYDDIYRMQSLYGGRAATRPTSRPRVTTRRPRVTTKRPSTKPSICDLKFDSMFMNGDDRRIYAFRYRKIYQFESDQNGIEKSFTKVSRKVLTPRVPINTGAAVVDRYKRLYVFKGTKLFRYTRFRLDAGFPKRITIPFFQNVDAALEYNNVIYVFKDDKFSIWHENYSRSPPSGYPKPISSYWKGIPNNVEAALNINDGYTYFFKGTKYFKYNNRYQRTEYRKDKAPAWLGCGRAVPK
ncbi:matrilysin-like [Mytilus trossulus]|uniref:matrilysin-like n=1 Tax=Mytilus trossulus TaxID=6551 RepID=UPI0030064855